MVVVVGVVRWYRWQRDQRPLVGMDDISWSAVPTVLVFTVLLSIVLLAVSTWIRLSMAESPAFKKMKEEGKTSKAPLTESFGQWKNLKIVILALIGLTAGQAVVWYTGQFYALFFLTQALKVDGATANIMIAISLLIGPGATAFLWVRNFGAMLAVASLVAATAALAGIYASFWLDSAPGPTIVLAMTILFALSLLRVRLVAGRAGT